MAKQVNNPSLDKVKECIDEKESFVLEAGAGSGKTTSLVEALKYIIEHQTAELKKTNRLIRCITYTNVAKDEIIERTYSNPLVAVSTIHDFLWSCIGKYQKELKLALVKLNAGTKNIESLDTLLKDKIIKYENFADWEEGIITHNDVIKLSRMMFEENPMLARIVCDQYPYIFVDEYQDTQPETVQILLSFLLKRREEKKDFVVGFFGDSMQNIYDSGVGSIKPESYEVPVKEITKAENYRCSRAVIELLYKIRPSLKQEPAADNKPGSVELLYNDGSLSLEDTYQKALKYLSETKKWDLSNGKVTKILYLTHRLIARQNNFPNLFKTYNDRYGTALTDMLYEKQCRYADFLLCKMEQLYEFYAENRFSDFMRLVELKFEENKQRKYLKDVMDELAELRKNKTIDEVIDFVLEKHLFRKTDQMKEYEKSLKESDVEEKKVVFYNSLMAVKYAEVIECKKFIDEKTPFSTKHGVKGTEFNNVLVVVDDSAWNRYSFKDVISGNGSSKKYNRTLNLFYVCCSRSKDNLAVLFLSDLGTKGLTNGVDWFGQGNVKNVSGL